MPRPSLPSLRCYPCRMIALLVFAPLLVAPAWARSPKLAKYPLRVHVLASGATHETPRMSPGEAVACDAVGDMLSSISPNPGGPVSLSGVSSDPCSFHAEMVTGRLLNSPDEDPIYSGEGRGDLVSPPETTQGFLFRYDDCTRVRVHPGFQSLPARWKRRGRKLEVLIPSDDIPDSGRTLPPVKCTFTVTLEDFVYLLLKNGKLIAVSQELYREKPSLRNFLSGGTQAVQRRVEPLAVASNATAQK